MDLLDPVTTHQPSLAALATITDAGRSTPCALNGRATGDLRTALEILAEQMHEAVARRRTSPPGTAPFRKADERVAYLVDLFRQLQQRMAIPDEVWGLGLRPLDWRRSARPTVGAGRHGDLSDDSHPGLM